MAQGLIIFGIISSGQSNTPKMRVCDCPKCGFKTDCNINSFLNFLKNDNYTLWQDLSNMLSIARCSFNPVSGAN